VVGEHALHVARVDGVRPPLVSEGGQMIKLVVLYGQPDDPGAFEAHYVDTHFPLADQMPHVRRVEMAKGLPGPDGSPPPAA